MPKHYIKNLIFCGLISSQLFSQQSFIKSNIQGQVIDSLTGKGIAFAQIFNESKREGTSSDQNGDFKISGSINDTLVITVMGYFGKVWICLPENKDRIAKILLTRRIYEIEPVTIARMPGTYKQFQKEFMDTKPDQGLIIEGLPRPVPTMIPQLLDTNVIRSTEFFVAHPIGYFYYNLSKEEKEKRKVFYLQQEQKEQVSINKKFNRDLVSQITGFEGDEITEFINFCKFDHQFLFHSSDYEIVEAIHKKLEEYKKRKPDEIK